MVSLRALGDVLVVRTPYDPSFVSELKTLPATDRSFDPVSKTWLVTPNHGQAVADMMLRHFGQAVAVPAVATRSARPETRVLEVRYIGTAKDRGAGEKVAFGWSGGQWALLFPEAALRDWFGQEGRPGEFVTLYGVLGIKQGADDTEVKSAYRRMARQWHPDTTREPDAAEQFRAIQHAYEVLRDPHVRRKYDAGLKLAGQSKTGSDLAAYISDSDYRSPLRCGLLLADGFDKLGKFQVTKIQQWHDIVDNQGRALVTSWPMGADIFIEEWL